MTEALWALVAFAVVVVVIALLFRGSISAKLKGLGTQLEVEATGRNEQPGAGGIDAGRLDAGRDLRARGRQIRLRRGTAGEDIDLTADEAPGEVDPKG